MATSIKATIQEEPILFKAPPGKGTKVEKNLPHLPVAASWAWIAALVLGLAKKGGLAFAFPVPAEEATAT